MTAIESPRDAEALDWVRRIADSEFDDWEDHIAWLEADAANATAFDRAVLIVETATEGLAAPSPSLARMPTEAGNDNPTEPTHHWRWSLLATSAAAAVAVAAWIGMKSDRGLMPTRYAITTPAGEPRVLSLADGSRVSLNGASRLELDHSDARSVRLADGEAYFTVKHDAAYPFHVTAGNAVFLDVGTSFDIKHDERATEIAVADGAVMFDPDHAALTLGKGQTMRIADKTATVQQIEPAAVGAWREGRLVYRDAPFPLVAEDIARAIGVPVVVDETQATRHFSGVIVLGGDRRHMLEHIGTVMNVGIERDGQGWRLKRRAE